MSTWYSIVQTVNIIIVVIVYVLHVNALTMRLFLWTAPCNGPIIHPPDKIRVTVELYWQEQVNSSQITWPSVTPSNTKPTWTDPGANTGLRVKRSALLLLSSATRIAGDLYWSTYMESGTMQDTPDRSEDKKNSQYPQGWALWGPRGSSRRNLNSKICALIVRLLTRQLSVPARLASHSRQRQLFPVASAAVW